jgi:hypothetical protein
MGSRALVLALVGARHPLLVLNRTGNGMKKRRWTARIRKFFVLIEAAVPN